MNLKLIKISILLIVATSVNGQSKLKQLTLTEIKNLIENHYTILGKTQSEIISMKRPTTISGLAKWDFVDTLNAEHKGNFEIKKYILIDTGLGVINVWISAKSNLAFAINYIPKQTLKKPETEKYLVNTFNLSPDKNSWSIKKKGTSTIISFSTMKIEHKTFKKFGLFQILILTMENETLKYYEI